MSEQGNGRREADAAAEPKAGAAAAVERRIREAAERALAEAAARRRQAEATHRETAPREIGGRDGPESVRYGDWEVKGLATDF